MKGHEIPSFQTALIDAKTVLEKYGAVSEKIEKSIAHGAIPIRGRQTYSEKIMDRWGYLKIAFRTDKMEMGFWYRALLAIAEMVFLLSSTVAFWSVFYFWFGTQNWKMACGAVLYSLFSAILLHAFETDPLNSTKRLLVFSFAKCCAAIYLFAKIYEKYGLTYKESTVHDFTTSLYFSGVTWTTLGYGDYSPSEQTKIWAVAEAFVGYVITALLIAFFVAMLIDKHNEK